MTRGIMSSQSRFCKRSISSKLVISRKMVRIQITVSYVHSDKHTSILKGEGCNPAGKCVCVREEGITNLANTLNAYV